MQHFYKKSLGQHFLVNKSILKKIASIKEIKDKIIFEIGPGQGALTKEILQNKPKKLVLMVQKEVAERLSAKVSTPYYSRLSVLIQLHAFVEKVFEVEPHNFNPAPKVKSTVIKITPYRNKKKNYDKLNYILKISFRQRRKTIKNNLKTFYIDAEKRILECGIDPNSRPQDLKPSDFEKLSKVLKV